MTDRKDSRTVGREFTVVVENHELAIRVERGSAVNQALESAGITLGGPCGGRGTCGQCEIVISEGAVTPPTRSELRRLSEHKRQEGHRLACQVRVLGDITTTVDHVESGGQRILTAGIGDLQDISPCVRAYDVEMEPPDLSDPRGDDRRVLDELRTKHGITCTRVDMNLLRRLPQMLRAQGWKPRALVREDQLIGLTGPESRLLGVAVDLGTTGIAAYLCDLEHGSVLAEAGCMNPQLSCGGDIITRIESARKSPDSARLLERQAIDGITRLIEQLTTDAQQTAQDIAELVVVGNTAMHHLLLGLPVDQLARAPHVPAVSMESEIKVRNVGLDCAPGAHAYLPPNPAAFVGSDHLAMLVACGAGQNSEPSLFIDIGTNTEICLVADGTLTSVSCASGPAFEGGSLTCGMPAGPGAIERLTLTDSGVDFRAIEGKKPRGLCGSGVVDLLSEMIRFNAVDSGGRLQDDHPRVRVVDDRLSFVVLESGEDGAERPIVVSQQDVRSLQLAKAAIAAGTHVLLRSRGLNANDLSQVVVAGAFGNYINVRSAQRVGLLPSVSHEAIEQVGNAAGMGAAMMLVSESARDEARHIATRINYLELAAHPDFKTEFLNAIPIPEK